MEEKEFDVRKALLLPLNSKRELFIQDRRGYKKPDWGYFGGSLEDGETPLEAVIRESKEELNLNLKEGDLTYLGTSITNFDGVSIIRYMYLYPTQQTDLEVHEGQGGCWLSLDEVKNYLDDKDRFDDIRARIERALL